MQFDDPAIRVTPIDTIAQARLDDLFSRAALRTPTDYALIDSPNRETFADGAPRYMSYAAADRMVSAIAGRLSQLGLPRNSVIGLHMPNMSEAVLALVAIARAGMIAAPLPLLWRCADVVGALGRAGAKAIIAGGRIGNDNLCDVALQAAAELFGVRYVCGFGAKLPDGVIALDELFTADRLDPMAGLARGDEPAAETAVITWDATSDRSIQGHVPVARSHAQLIAGGLAVAREARLADGARILAAQSFASFPGMATTVVPWLLSGGTLVLHHGFDPEIFVRQCGEHDCDSVVLPGPLAATLNDAGLFSQTVLRNVLGVWRTPERLAASAIWRHASAEMVDVQAFGETGLIAARRASAGQPETFSARPENGSHSSDHGGSAVEISRSKAGTLLLRGPMVPCGAYPPGSAGTDEPHEAEAAGFVDTGYPCRIEPTRLVITGPPAGMINVGGYRFAQRDLSELTGQSEHNASLTALPDPYLSNRLAGRAMDRAAVQRKLIAEGANALIVGAFRNRRDAQAA